MEKETTTSLLNTLLNTDAEHMNNFINHIDADRRPCDVFHEYFARTNLTPAVAVNGLKGLMSKSYIYEIFGGNKVNPSRDALLLICLALNMNFKETKQVLESYQLAPLYPKDKRDAIIGICINNKIYNITLVNDKLFEADENQLGIKE